MAHQSGLLLIRAQDASAAIAFASRFALVCIANFAFGFGAGYIFAHYRNSCEVEQEEETTQVSLSKEEETECQAEELNATKEEETSKTVPQNAVEEERGLTEMVPKNYTPAESSQPEPKSPPGTPLRTEDDSLSENEILTNPDARPLPSEASQVKLHEAMPQFEKTATAEEQVYAHVAEKTDIDDDDTDSEVQESPTLTAADAEADGSQLQESTGEISVAQLHIQPIHGCRAQSVASLRLNQNGVENHLMYAVAEFTGRYISDDKVPALREVSPTVLENGDLYLEAPDVTPLRHQRKSWGQMKRITICGVQYEAVDQGDIVSKFFVDFLEIPGVRLLLIRPPPIAGESGQTFRTWPSADRPLLLAGADVVPQNSNSDLPLRPNVGLSNTHSEMESWMQIKIGDYSFELVKTDVSNSTDSTTTENQKHAGHVLLPVDLKRDEWTLRSGQVVTVTESY
ncbi:hypothetical protein BWQ96_02442 [Gracilariopsis chorda]|uniref:Molybdenum cofactor sulfurase middle domain-containing protein n=1 Tax=Gracilariopsis chorda TaxID=448386 RepID=A0A2V3J2Z2_9FLOR|nr:hypothetical protein BWQ96_02442 [Gracilariopsis chorda]|eukprot:PXF47760.1 hypothetical protein BWQ96_02442 [Gracilariopsis chorda]